MNRFDEFEKLLAKLSPEQKEEWIPLLHKQFSERFLKDNDRIWTVSSIFIPLSLAGLSSLRDTTFTAMLPLAIGSIGLICFWYLVCERHRVFQDHSKDIVKSIENNEGIIVPKAPDVPSLDSFNLSKTQIPGKYILLFLRQGLEPFLLSTNIQRARKYMLRFVIGIWVLALVISYFKQYNGTGVLGKDRIGYYLLFPLVTLKT